MNKSTKFIMLLILLSTVCVSQDYLPFECSFISESKKSDPEGFKSGCNASSAIYNTKFRDSNSEYYRNMDNFPIRTIGLRFVILQKDDGTGNFQDTEEHINEFYNIVQGVNDIYSNLEKYQNREEGCSEYIPLVNDSKVRFSLERENIVFIKDSKGWDCKQRSGGWCTNYNRCPNHPGQYLVQNFGDNTDNLIDVFWVEDGCLWEAYSEYNGEKINCYLDFERYAEALRETGDHCAYSVMSGCASGTSEDFDEYYNGGAVIMQTYFSRYTFDNYHDCWHPTPSRLLAHELGHNLIPDFDHDNSSNCQSLMGSYTNSSFIKKSWLGIFNRALTTHATNQYVIDCNISEELYVVDSDQSFDFNLRLYQNVLIKSGVSLNVECDLRLPDDAIIYKEPNATLNGVENIKQACSGNSFTNIKYVGDIGVKDSNVDNGEEPNNIHPNWNSSSIWIKNNLNSSNEIHETPVYLGPGSQAYVFVKISDFSDLSLFVPHPQSKLKLYWAHASTGLDWMGSFDGSRTTNFPPFQSSGGFIGEIEIGDIKFDNNNDAIVYLPWELPEPGLFTDNHFCILARVEERPEPPFGMAYPEQVNNGTYFNVRNNNNIAQRNTIVTVPDKVIPLDKFTVSSVESEPTSNNVLKFKSLSSNNETILDFGSINVDLDRALFDAWQSNGSRGEGVSVEWEIRDEIRKVLGQEVLIPTLLPTLKIESENAFIEGIPFEAKQQHSIGVRMNSFTKLLQTKPKLPNGGLVFSVEHYNDNTPVGGEELVFKNLTDLIGQEIKSFKSKQSQGDSKIISLDENQIILSPNPMETIVRISTVYGDSYTRYNLVLFDCHGKIVHKSDFKGVHTITNSDLPTGIYTVILTDLKTKEIMTSSLIVK